MADNVASYFVAVLIILIILIFIKKTREARISRISDLLSKYSVDDKIIGSEGLELVNDVCVMYVFINQDNLLVFSESSSKVVEIVINNQAVIINNLGGLIQVALTPIGSNSLEGLRRLAHLIVESLGSEVRLLICCSSVAVGTVGVSSRKCWGIYPSNLSAILQSLLDCVPGSVVEMKSDNSW